MKLSDLIEQRAPLLTRMQDAHTKDDSGAFEAAQTELRALDAKIDRQKALDDADRRAEAVVIHGEPADKFADLERRVSLQRLIRFQTEGRALDGVEAEYNAEVSRRNGKGAQGAYFPLRGLFETRVTTAASASELVGTEHRPDQFVEGLRNALLARRLGVRVLGGLTQNQSIPKFGTSTTSAWVADNSALTPSDMTFDDLGLTPKHVGVLSEMSRQLIQQSNPAIEQLFRDDMSFQIAKAIDSALIVGGGSNEPSGVIDTLGTANATLATPTWDEILAIVEQVETANALGNMSWIMSPGVRALLRGTLKVSGDAGAGFIMEGGQIDGAPAFVTNQMPLAEIIFGDWSQVILGVWSELDILVNPYESTAYTKGNVSIRAMATCDIGIRHEEAFAWADDVPVPAS